MPRLCDLCILCGFSHPVFKEKLTCGSVLRRTGAMNNKEMTTLCDRIRQTAYDIHVYHAHGHLEKVYENALAHRLRKAGLDVKQQHPIQVFDEDGTVIGDYLADLLVAGEVVIELKAAKALAAEHDAQILGYLKSARLQHGLLINFGSYRFEIRKFIWEERTTAKSAAAKGI